MSELLSVHTDTFVIPDSLPGIILCGHGGFACGLEKAVKQILGQPPRFIAIDFPETSTTALLTSQMQDAIATLQSANEILFLTDLLGGTPFRVASTLAMLHGGHEVIAGINLQLVLEAVMEREGLCGEALRKQALTSGHQGLTCLADELQRAREPDELTDGI